MKKFDVYSAAHGYTREALRFSEFAGLITIYEAKRIARLKIGETYERVNRTLRVTRTA